MSAFLAPIHSWVFNKIKLYEHLEKNLIDAFEDKFGSDIKTIVKSAQENYGLPLEDKPIEDLIDLSNIHGWLQGRIDIAETRHAEILAKAFKKYGQEAVDTALKVYEEQGAYCGNEAKSHFPVGTAPEIYKALNNYLLEGMPCDLVNIVVKNEPDRVQWNNIRCLHRGYWESVGADIETLYRLRHAWIKSFITNANSDFTYRVTPSEFDGEPGFVNEIVKK